LKCAAGRLHLSILIETMRREGYEMAVTNRRHHHRARRREDGTGRVRRDRRRESTRAVIESVGRVAQMSTCDRRRDAAARVHDADRAIFGLRGELMSSRAAPP